MVLCSGSGGGGDGGVSSSVNKLPSFNYFPEVELGLRRTRLPSTALQRLRGLQYAGGQPWASIARAGPGHAEPPWSFANRVCLGGVMKMDGEP